MDPLHEYVHVCCKVGLDVITHINSSNPPVQTKALYKKGVTKTELDLQSFGSVCTRIAEPSTNMQGGIAPSRVGDLQRREKIILLT